MENGEPLDEEAIKKKMEEINEMFDVSGWMCLIVYIRYEYEIKILIWISNHYVSNLNNEKWVQF